MKIGQKLSLGALGLTFVPLVLMAALLLQGATGVIVKPFDPMTLPQDILPYWEHGRGVGGPPKAQRD